LRFILIGFDVEAVRFAGYQPFVVGDEGESAGCALDREAARLDALKSCAKANAGECIVRATDCNK